MVGWYGEPLPALPAALTVCPLPVAVSCTVRTFAAAAAVDTVPVPVPFARQYAWAGPPPACPPAAPPPVRLGRLRDRAGNSQRGQGRGHRPPGQCHWSAFP